MEANEPILKSYSKKPEGVGLRTVTVRVEYSVFASGSEFYCPLAIVPKEGEPVSIEAEVWRAAGIQRAPEVQGKQVELKIGLEEMPPFGFQERVIGMRVLEEA